MNENLVKNAVKNQACTFKGKCNIAAETLHLYCVPDLNLPEMHEKSMYTEVN